MGVHLEFTLTEREADAVLRALDAEGGGLTLGHGVRKSQALRVAEMKIAQAIFRDRADRTARRQP